MGVPGWKLWDALSARLEADGVLDDYDLVLLDTPPALAVSDDQSPDRSGFFDGAPWRFISGVCFNG